MFKKPHKSIYLNAANEANHTMKSGHDGCAAISIPMPPLIAFQQCWTEGRSSTAVVEDLGPTATATVAEV